MKFINKAIITLASTAFLMTSLQSAAQEQTPQTLNELLRLVEEGRLTETEEQRQRLQNFRANVQQQEALLNEMEEAQAAEERISGELENQYNENEIRKAQLFETLQERQGDLEELFGTMAGIVGDTQTNFENSLISAQFPGRSAFLAELAGILTDESDLPSTQELERLWFYMLQEINESGNVVKFNTNVAQADGTVSTQEVVRIGSYNIVSNGAYLMYNGTTGRLSVLPRQPTQYTGSAAALQAANSGVVRVGIDPTGPTGGSFLSALISEPSLAEQFEQGKPVGPYIAGAGVIALLLALERMLTLSIVGVKVKSQLKNLKAPKKNNPLGRVLMVYEQDKNMDIETLELKLGEAILQEMPPLERFLTALKIIATVAPLMGLLGTVTGMITVFQAITLFGTGDPQVMAGGISAALVTTVMGLIVAIPTVLLHTLVKWRSDKIVHILEEQATGIIARKSEAGGKSA
ncbi:MAG: MotA/TolQ/ExbB proton channel family protein [Pseudohongiellaceae bacterium]